MPKLIELRRNQSIADFGAGGTTIDPLLTDIIAGVDTPVAPDIVLLTPKAAGIPGAVVTVLATGGLNIQNAAAAPGLFDMAFLRMHTIQRVLANIISNGTQKYGNAISNTAVANGAGTVITPALFLNNVAAALDLAFPVPKVVPGAVTRQDFIATVLGAGTYTVQHGEGAPVNNDQLALANHSIQELTAALFGSGQSQRRYFVVLNGVNLGAGSVYADNADATRTFVVTRAKVAADGSLLVQTAQLTGTTFGNVAGQLNLVAGTGDATVAFSLPLFEKLVDVRQNVAVANGAGLTFDPGIVENGVRFMPDIVLAVPKAAATVPFVATDLTGAPGTVVVAHNNAGPINHDIMSIRWHSIFRDIV